jgi:kynurenine formamidase
MDRDRQPQAVTLQYTRVVSLSHVLRSDIPRWPGDPPVEYQPVAQLDRQGYFLRRACLGEHSGTHMNAPVSFHQGGEAIHEYPPQSLVVPAVVMERQERAAADPDYALTCRDIQQWENEFGPVPAGSVFLLNTGWAQRWAQPVRFFNNDANGQSHFPGFSLEAARYLLDHRHVAGLGIDTHGVDGGLDDTYAVNRLTLQRPRIVLENLANLDQLPPVGATLVIGLLLLEGGSGSPVSVLALVP